ncbi:CARD- and ANK-domain containing inflammasome adapter protein-like [Haliotis rufescens]|uniref:CARD- and ANK-domain containing inflammasome adapter protein-like n=1 Tax=Haliotis rufescens TaxID=6454 RepID=UPI00201F420C|nr:CARD- and ANK-domain containing inflammasome adapter protein-like [Haliotis rufescens]
MFWTDVNCPMDISVTYLNMGEFRDLMIIPVAIMVLHYINLFTPSQNPRSSRLWDTARTVCFVTPFIYMFPIEMMKYHAIAIWAIANSSTQDGRIAMLLVEVLLWVLPVRAWFGWYNICICLPGLWSVIPLVATEPRSTHHSVELGEESTAGAEGKEKDEITEKSHDIDNVRQAVVSNHTKSDDSSDFQNSARKNKDTLYRIDVTGVSGGTADEVFASAFQNSTRNEDVQPRVVVTGVSGGSVGKAFTAGRDINYEPTIRDNVVTGPGNISENVQQAIQNPLSANGRLSETDLDDASEKQQDITNRTVITNNTVQQDHTSATDSSFSNTQMRNVIIKGNPDLSCLDRTRSGATRDSTESATDEDCDAQPRNVTPETKEDNVRTSRRQGVNKTAEDTNPSREFIQMNAKQDEILEIIKAVTPKEIHSLLKDAKREASEASSAIATLKDAVASNSYVVDEMDHLRSKFAELNTVADTLKEAKHEADAASSTVATMKQEVASTSRQVVDEMDHLRSKFAELNTVADTLKEAKHEADAASSTVATMKQEVASTSRQVVDEMDHLRSKFAELNTVADTLKEAKHEADAASSTVATMKQEVASTSRQVVDEMDHLRSKFAELNTVADTLKEAKHEADAASSTVATMKQEVASTSRQVVDEMDHLRSKFTELNTVADTLKEAKHEADAASSTVATMKQEVASTSRQVVDEMDHLRSKFTELNRVTDTIKEAKREASEASSTVATMKQEVEELHLKLADLTIVVDALQKNVDTVPDAGAQITTYGIDSKQHDTEAKEKFKKTGRTPIMLAARVGDKNEFDRLIQTPGIDLSVSDKQSNNLLHIACLGGNSDIVSDLLSREMDINARGQYGRTPLMLAAQKGHTPLVNLLIRHGVNSKLVDRDGNSAIHMACLGAELNVMKYLVEKEGFDVNEKGKNGMTPVMIAAEKSYEDIVRYLVEKNCDLNSLDTDGRNCRSYALQGGNERIVAYITSRLQQLTFEW